MSTIGRRSFIVGIGSAATVALASNIGNHKKTAPTPTKSTEPVLEDFATNFDVPVDSLPKIKEPSIVIDTHDNMARIKMSLHDQHILCKTIFAEARGEGDLGMKAVVHVIFNRVLSKDPFFAKDVTVADTCLRGSQFSCWLKKIKMKIKMNMIDTNSDEYRKVVDVVEDAHFDYENGKDYSRDALFYVNKKIKMPKWVRTMNTTTVINNHIFFKPKNTATV